MTAAATMDAREDEMVALHESGMSLRRIGAQFDLSGERVRQILQARGINTERRATVTERTENLDDAIRRMIESGREENRQYSASEIAAALGSTTTRVSSRVRALDLAGWVVYPVANQKKRVYSDEDILGALKDTATALGVTRLSAKAYAAHRKMNPDLDHPSESLIIRRYPSWSDACVTAGLEPHEERPGGYVRRFSDEMLADSVADYIEECVSQSVRPTARGYTDWARDNHRLAFSTIALNLGPRAWAKARTIGYDRLDERGTHE
jgi:hypothetical protein